MTRATCRQLLQISDVVFVAASQEHADTGLLGWLGFSLNRSLRVEGCTLRRTLTGNVRVAFPARRDRAGRQRFFVRPLDETVRCDVEQQVLRDLGLCAEAQP